MLDEDVSVGIRRAIGQLPRQIQSYFGCVGCILSSSLWNGKKMGAMNKGFNRNGVLQHLFAPIC